MLSTDLFLLANSYIIHIYMNYIDICCKRLYMVSLMSVTSVKLLILHLNDDEKLYNVITVVITIYFLSLLFESITLLD